MTFRGIVRGKVIKLEGMVVLPEGSEVDVKVKKAPKSGKGEPRRIVAALEKPSRCTPEEVDLLVQAMNQGKRPVRFAGPFDRKGK